MLRRFYRERALPAYYLSQHQCLRIQTRKMVHLAEAWPDSTWSTYTGGYYLSFPCGYDDASFNTSTGMVHWNLARGFKHGSGRSSYYSCTGLWFMLDDLPMDETNLCESCQRVDVVGVYLDEVVHEEEEQGWPVRHRTILLARHTNTYLEHNDNNAKIPEQRGRKQKDRLHVFIPFVVHCALRGCVIYVYKPAKVTLFGVCSLSVDISVGRQYETQLTVIKSWPYRAESRSPLSIQQHHSRKP